ncbi:porin family protein [Lacinutrix sp. Hel_I_90]|uniref:porin family protein n=1 Tax=Lacinutrix sp. Hel_I_90 TaxID=1249999 RepID=UPI0005C9BA60|nr:porin family protein [Lacinutrix sp. Hel_I_90]
MKKNVLILTFILFSIYSFSQNALYGVRAGYNISNLDFEPDVPAGIENRHRNGIAVGFFSEYYVSENVSFAPEIQFSAEGAKAEFLRINYIQMPLFLKYKITEVVAIGVGPQVSVKGHDYKDGQQNLAFSGLGGLEYSLTDNFFLDVRYSYGFTNVFDDETNIEAKNTNMQIGFGVKF